MKPLTKSGGLVDKREQLIFEAYKNRPLVNCEHFKKEIRDNYGFMPSTNLYREIVNYQVKNFGETLDNTTAEPIKYFNQKKYILRVRRRIRDVERQRHQRNLERLERNENKQVQ